MKKLFLILLFSVLTVSLVFSKSLIKGVVNDNNVRVRDNPNLNGKVVGNVNQNDIVVILGRTQNRMIIDGLYSYWIKIEKESETGWVYGAYINIDNIYYTSLPVLDSSSVFDVLHKSQEKNILVNQEKDRLKTNYIAKIKNNPEEIYSQFSVKFKTEQSLMDVFLFYIEMGITETDRTALLESSEVSEYIQQSYFDDLKLSNFNFTDKNYFFWISGFEQKASFSGIDIKTIIFNISKIENTNSEDILNNYILDKVIISPYSENDFENNTDFISFIRSTVEGSYISDFYKMVVED